MSESNTNTLYLVVAEHGYYDDYRTWNVRGFLTEAEAQTYRDQAQARGEQIGDTASKLWLQMVGREITAHEYAEHMDQLSNELDPFAYAHSDAPRYSVEALPLGE